MKLTKLKGVTSQRELIYIRHSTTGAGLTGLAFNTASLVAYYVRPGGSPTAITLATLANAQAAFSSGGFVEVDATNMPGLYMFHVPDAVYATGVDAAVVMLKGATNMEALPIEYALEAVNAQDTVRMGMTALPNAAAEAAGGLYTRGTGAGQINQPSNGRLSADVTAISGDTTAADNCESFFDGTGYAGTANTIPTVGTVNALGNGAIAAASFAANAIDSGALAASAGVEIAAAVLGATVEDEPTYTLQQALSVILSFAAGRTTNGGATFKSPNNVEDRIVASVNGANERTAITLTPAGL